VEPEGQSITAQNANCICTNTAAQNLASHGLKWVNLWNKCSGVKLRELRKHGQPILPSASTVSISLSLLSRRCLCQKGLISAKTVINPTEKAASSILSEGISRLARLNDGIGVADKGRWNEDG
jgi:hypothetical protein